MHRGGRAEPTPPECALAAEMFDHFCSAGTMKQILALHREICNTLTLRPNKLPDFYPKLKAKLTSSWKAQALFKKFDARANHKVYAKGRACAQSKVLIIGAGPCGLRAAIECQLLGAKVVVIEKRDRMSRNNVLHLWPFVIQDLRALGAKKFFGKFCAGSIDHISIRQLQCILLKVALLLGVEFHEGVSFEVLLEPTVAENTEKLGWRASVTPSDHPVAQYEFDCLLGADGKRNTLQGFKRKEFRGKLAMAITANFINRHTEQEASVPEISGVAFIFNQKFFKELYEETGIDLENIVYYKDDTHYFVMTAKKHSLLVKGVLLNDFAEVSRLLSVENVDRAALMRYAQEAARFSTDARLPLRDFALNHYGEPDVALFDFTSMYAAENASLVFERHGRRLLCELVGDSLLEPFWPTGSGCARGFLSALDAAWAVRAWGQTPGPHPLEVIAERESIYRLLAQTTPENLHRDFGAYTLDPGTRYPNLNRHAVTPHRVTSFYNSDDPLPLDAPISTRKRRRESVVSEEALLAWVGSDAAAGVRGAASPAALTALVRRYRPDLLPVEAPEKTVYHILQHEFGIQPVASPGSIKDTPDAKIRSFLMRVYSAFKGDVPHVFHESDVFNQIKQSQQERHSRTTEHTPSLYSSAVTTDEKRSESGRRSRKRRSLRTPQVSTPNDLDEYIRRKIGKLDINKITHLKRYLDGQAPAPEDEGHRAEKQRALQEEILNLFDPEESADMAAARDSLAHIFSGYKKPINIDRIQPPRKEQDDAYAKISHFFEPHTPVARDRPARRLKGLDASTVRIFSIDDSSDDDTKTITHEKPSKIPLKKDFVRSHSTDAPLGVAEQVNGNQTNMTFRRSNSIGCPEMAYDPSCIRDATPPERGSKGTEVARRRQKMLDIIADHRKGPTLLTTRARTNRSQSIGTPEMAMRRQKVADLIEGRSGHSPSPDQYAPRRRNSGEIAMKMQRMSDIIQAQKIAPPPPRSGHGRRKAAREIMKQRFEKSLQMLAAESQLVMTSSTDLENDYGLQQYRASAPQFDERVKKLERKLQHFEEGRIVGGGVKGIGGGVRVAKLAAELASGGTPASVPKSTKPKDLMRSVGKIERDDWNVKEIEKKIMENRLGRPEPKTAEKVPKWDREQFLGRQRRLKEGDAGEEKWGEIDETLQKLDQKLRDSGRPDQGTKKVANLATKFVKKEDPECNKNQAMETSKRSWRGSNVAGVQCAACGTRVFAAESVIADGLHLHRGCFRCAICKAVLRPGNYTMERYGSRLVCLRHSGVSVPDAVLAASRVTASIVPAATPERISIEVSDSGAREIDEDEWTDRNFLPSETSVAGGLSDEEDSSSDEYTDAEDSADEGPDAEGPVSEGHGAGVGPGIIRKLYFSDDSFGYDDYSDDGAESSGAESCSRMRAALEARRREVPADARPPTDSSEVESEEESDTSEDISSATEVSTDSEFAREETAPAPTPPAIMVTEVPPPPPPAPPRDYPLSRTRSTGGIATKRALELKRRYLLGEPSPPAVRKSDSTSQLDTKLEAVRSTITEFQKLLHPAPVPQTALQRPVLVFQLAEQKPMPDIIKNLCDAPVDLLTKGDSALLDRGPDWREATPVADKAAIQEIDSDSLSEDSSVTETAPKSVPRVEVHDEGGELIQLDSLMIINADDKDDRDDKVTTQSTTGPTVLGRESESSESCKDATTLALTETELSDWAAESAVLEDCGLEDERSKRSPNKSPRALSGPKAVHDAKNLNAISSHVCGRSSPTETIVYSNALEHFEFADEGDEDPSLGTVMTPRNEGYVEFVDNYSDYSPVNDRSMNFIERRFSETVFKPMQNAEVVEIESCEATHLTNFEGASSQAIEDITMENVEDESPMKSTDSESMMINTPEVELKTPQLLITLEKEASSDDKEDKSSQEQTNSMITDDSVETKGETISMELSKESSNFDEISPPLAAITPVSSASGTSKTNLNTYFPSITFANPTTFKVFAPAICRSASETFNRSMSRSTSSPTQSFEMSTSLNLSSGSVSPVSPLPARDTTDKVQEIKREREEQTEVVRRLVLERMGSGPRVPRKSVRRARVSPASMPPPVPPPPSLPSPPPPPPPPVEELLPPRPAPPLHATPSFSDPELNTVRRRKGFMSNLSNLLHRRRTKDSPGGRLASRATNKSTGALASTEAPPVPPPPARYYPSTQDRRAHDARQRNRTSSDQQAAAVAELVQVSAQRDAHQAMLAADRRRINGGAGN